jgi:hypothetical protein
MNFPTASGGEYVPKGFSRHAEQRGNDFASHFRVCSPSDFSASGMFPRATR